MSAPTVTFRKITGQGTGSYANVLARLDSGSSPNVGPQSVQVGTGASSPNDRQDFGSVQANNWSVPYPFVMQFDGNSASQLAFRLYDKVSGLEDFFDGVGGDWSFKIKLFKDWTDPTGITSSAINAWDALPYGTSVAGYSFDTYKPNPGNDGTSNLLVPHATVGSRWITNFYVYIAVKPESNAVAGEHVDWSYRANYVWPNP